MAKSKFKYKVYRPGCSSPYFQDTSLWGVLRDIAYAFKDGDILSFTIVKEKQ